MYKNIPESLLKLWFGFDVHPSHSPYVAPLKTIYYLFSKDKEIFGSKIYNKTEETIKICKSVYRHYNNFCANRLCTKICIANHKVF